MAAENEGGIGGEENESEREQWYPTPRLCPRVKHTMALCIGADNWPAERRGEGTSAATLKQERSVSGGREIGQGLQNRKDIKAR